MSDLELLERMGQLIGEVERLKHQVAEQAGEIPHPVSCEEFRDAEAGAWTVSYIARPHATETYGWADFRGHLAKERAAEYFEFLESKYGRLPK